MFLISLVLLLALANGIKTETPEDPWRPTPIWQSNSVDNIAQKFSEKMVKAIESKNVITISKLFKNDFILNGCRRNHTMSNYVEMLSKIEKGTKFEFNSKTVEDHGASIEFAMTAKKPNGTDITVEFALNKRSQQLKNGRVIDCPSSNP